MSLSDEGQGEVPALYLTGTLPVPSNRGIWLKYRYLGSLYGIKRRWMVFAMVTVT